MTAVVGMRPNVENSWPMPTPKANVSSATRNSEETTRPNPGAALAGRVEPRLREHEHRHERDERQPLALRLPQDAPEDRRVPVVDLPEREREIESERDAADVERDETGDAADAERDRPQLAAREAVRPTATDVPEVAAFVRRAGGLLRGRRLACHGDVSLGLKVRSEGSRARGLSRSRSRSVTSQRSAERSGRSAHRSAARRFRDQQVRVMEVHMDVRRQRARSLRVPPCRASAWTAVRAAASPSGSVSHAGLSAERRGAPSPR